MFILIGIIFYNLAKQRNAINSFKLEYADTINEAKQLKQDLNLVMENAVDISRSLIDELDKKAAKLNSLPHSSKQAAKETPILLESDQLNTVLPDFELSHHINILDDSIISIEKLLLATAEDPEDEEKQVMSEMLTEEVVNIEDIKKVHPYIAVRILHDQGHDIKKIAKLLGRGQGEVKLLLNLAAKSTAI
ncbi:MAG TPA: hypothetical protein VFC73_00750 [Syntrophomonadaceae bacterium]|nr:hypothetical protein [Syntrophomonadaceae bacterium]